MSRNILHKSSIDIFVKNINTLIQKYDGPIAFSKQIEAGYQAVLYWSKGKNLPDGATLLRIHEKCGVSLDWLLTGRDAYGVQCPYCGDWPEETRRACNEVKTILTSNDDTVKTALRSNIAAFKESIEKNKKTHHRGTGKSPGSPPGADSAVKSAAG